MTEHFLSEFALRYMMDTRDSHKNSELHSTISRDTDANGANFPNLQILTIRQISREGGSLFLMIQSLFLMVVIKVMVYCLRISIM